MIITYVLLLGAVLGLHRWLSARGFARMRHRADTNLTRQTFGKWQSPEYVRFVARRRDPNRHPRSAWIR